MRYLIPFCYMIVFLCLAEIAQAQHPIDVQRSYVQGQYYDAVLTFEKMPRRTRTLAAEVSAGKAAWALSLPERALAVFEKALRDESISEHERQWLLFSRAVISYQEDRFEEALAYAESALKEFPAGEPITARIHALQGQALMRLEDYVQAITHFNKALESCAKEDEEDLHYLAGLSHFRVGEFKESRGHLEQLPADYEETAGALRMLTYISLEDEQYDEAEHWLNKGRSYSPEAFLDSWSDYARLKIATAQGDEKRSRSILEQSLGKYPPSDGWLAMMEASAELAHWNKHVDTTTAETSTGADEGDDTSSE